MNPHFRAFPIARLSSRRAPVLRAFSAVLVVCSVGCAGGASDTRSLRSGSATRLVRADLDEVRHVSDAYAAVQLLRPAWLRSRGSTMTARNLTAQVVVDGIVMPNGLNALRSIRTNDVEAMDYISASDATTRYGTGFLAGAIVVVSRR